MSNVVSFLMSENLEVMRFLLTVHYITVLRWTSRSVYAVGAFRLCHLELLLRVITQGLCYNIMTILAIIVLYI